MAAKDTPATPEPKRGLLTTEFAVAALLIVFSAAMVLFGNHLDAKDWLDYTQWVGGSYIVSRGISKVQL